MVLLVPLLHQYFILCDDGREWIEIFNSADTSVDLSNWKLYENGTNHGLELIQGTSVLSPNQYAVIVDDKNEFLKDYPAHSGTIFDSCFALNNNGEELTIKNQDLFIDKVNYSSAWEADGDGNSLQKIQLETSASYSWSNKYLPFYFFN
ncbi:MAG: lamin tail domain-containing protein [Candidatus Heimdallarchaeaceae archaeon]